MQINNESLYTPEHHIRQLFLGKQYTLISTGAGALYSLLWVILFIVFTEKNDLPENCRSIVNWNKALYALLIISILFNIASAIAQMIYHRSNNHSKIPKLILGVKTIYCYVIGIIMIIGITVAFFKTEYIEKCGNLRYVNYAYIISEWILIGGCITCFCCMCNYALFCSSSQKKYNSEIVITDTEMRKIC